MGRSKQSSNEMSKKPSKINRTGIAASPSDGKRMVGLAEKTEPTSPGDRTTVARYRTEAFRNGRPIGTVPPPTSLKGIAKTAAKAAAGKKPTVFVDKLAERLAFERTGTRLYETLLAKYDAKGGFDGGPRREDLEQFHREEARHFTLLKGCLERLGADPTAMTPSADLAAVESMGVVQILSDPRTDLSESLHALLVAELVDHEGWEMLIQLADDSGQSDMAEQFRDANREEEHHLESVREWIAAHAEGSLAREL